MLPRTVCKIVFQGVFSWRNAIDFFNNTNRLDVYWGNLAPLCSKEIVRFDFCVYEVAYS